MVGEEKRGKARVIYTVEKESDEERMTSLLHTVERKNCIRETIQAAIMFSFRNIIGKTNYSGLALLISGRAMRKNS